MHNEIDLAQFKTIYPKWQNCTDEELQFWSELSGCLFCLPKQCPALVKKIPYLMLAHVLKVNQVECTPIVDSDVAIEPDACACDDRFINDILASGARVSSASIEGISVSFDNSGINTTLASVGKSPFAAWLAQTPEGKMIAAILSRMHKGVHMAVGSVHNIGAFGDDQLILNQRRLTLGK